MDAGLETLSRNEGQSFRKDLNLEHFVTDVIFIHEILIHPEVKDRVPLVAASIQAVSTDNSLVLMYHDQSESHHLEDWEATSSGSRKLPAVIYCYGTTIFASPLVKAIPQVDESILLAPQNMKSGF